MYVGLHCITVRFLIVVTAFIIMYTALLLCFLLLWLPWLLQNKLDLIWRVPADALRLSTDVGTCQGCTHSIVVCLFVCACVFVGVCALWRSCFAHDVDVEHHLLQISRYVCVHHKWYFRCHHDNNKTTCIATEHPLWQTGVLKVVVCRSAPFPEAVFTVRRAVVTGPLKYSLKIQNFKIIFG